MLAAFIKLILAIIIMQERKKYKAKNRQTKIKAKECKHNETHFTSQTINAL